jgi:hypothetical protein
MSYRALRFLTVFLFLNSLAIAPLAAQRDLLKRELEDLASPIALERAHAVARIVAIEQDIAADLRVAYKIADLHEQLGLLEASQLRADGALMQQAAEGLGDADERLALQSREYLMALEFEALLPDSADFTDAQVRAWDSFFTFRLRRDIAQALLAAHILPGKFLGQFDALRRFDAARLDRELLAVMAADPSFAEALNRAATETLARPVPAERAFQAPWRRLQMGNGAFAPALAYLQEMKQSDNVKAGVKLHGRTAFMAALEVACGVRAAAVRALAESPQQGELIVLLTMYYDQLLQHLPDPEFASAIAVEDLCVELELTLARFGESALLTARIETLRAQIQRVDDPRANVNMQVASRPDLIAQNQIAHLLLRAGDAEGAEREWTAAVDTGLSMLALADGRNRASLSSYLAAVYYNLACAQSLQVKLTRSMASLREAVRYGYKDFGWMLEDGDLEGVRASDDFRDWFMDVAPPSVADRAGLSR